VPDQAARVLLKVISEAVQRTLEVGG